MRIFLPNLPRIALALALSFCAHVNAQNTYPNKPIKMIIPLAAGSAVDNAARVLTLKMGENMGQGLSLIHI
jgi:tripartite-type tricarboxylate transporter receptor subunit TctC